MYEVVEKILYGVSFIAIGGAVALIFFVMFAPSILGSKAINEQLEKIRQQTEEMTEQLKQIAQLLEKGKKNSKKED
jgi:type II secretory pathway component PulM